MTITLNDGPATVRSVLFPSGDTAAEVPFDHGLASITSIDWSALTAATGDAVRSDFTEAVHALLDLSLGEILVAGWRSHRELKAAAERTLQPGGVETVDLMRHRIQHEASPYVEVLLNGAEVGRVSCEISVTIEVSVVSARVQMGRLAALHSGDAAVTITLSVAGNRVAASGPHQIRLPLDVSLGNGVPLV